MEGYLLELGLEGAREHVWEHAEGKWKQELCEGDDDEEREGNNPENICGCAGKLLAFPTSQCAPIELLPDQPGGHPQLKSEQFKTHLQPERGH